MKQRLQTLDALRGIAALGVVLFHYTCATLPTLRPNFLEPFLKYGKNGVFMFFVISGFIIPYSMAMLGYDLKDYGRNLGRRMLRIAPPAYLTMFLHIGIQLASLAVFHHYIEGMDWPGLGWNALLGNLLFCVSYFDTGFYISVYWTLEIEFQFYILIGLLLPLLLKINKIGGYYLVFIPMLALSFVPYPSFFMYAPYFVMGNALFLWYGNKIDKVNFWVMIGLASVAVLVKEAYPAYIFAMITVLMLSTGVEINTRASNYLGKISYSLYLTHTSVGLVAETVLKNVISIHHHTWGKMLLLVVYILIAIGVAGIFYELVEKRFIQLSKKIAKRH